MNHTDEVNNDVLFLWHKKNKIKKEKKSTLRTFRNLRIILLSKLKSYKKRKSLSITSSKRQGSITVEASLVLPTFIFCSWILLYLLEVFSIYGNIQGALHQQAKQLSKYAYVYENVLKMDNNAVVDGIGTYVFAQTYVKNEVINYLGEDYLNSTCIKNGENGLSFLRSNMYNNNMIDLVVEYSIEFPFSILTKTLPITQRCRIRGFTGYDPELTTHNTEEMVFITKTGSVYHKDRNCSHIKLSIEYIDYEQVHSMRNESGNKYYPCEICTKAGHMPLVYITTDGTRYHNTLSCSGLKRTVYEIPISKVGNKRPCSRCGG